MGKDANAPKRPSSAYMQWLNNGERARVMAANPGMKVGQVAKICGVNWKSVPESVKAPLTEAYHKQMAVWKLKMAEYKQSDNYKTFQDAKASAKKKKGKKKPKDKNAPKRNLSAYFLFLSEFRTNNPNFGLTETSTKAGAKWKSLGPAERAPFEKQAAADKSRYMREMETYKTSADYSKHQAVLKIWKKNKGKKTRASWKRVMDEGEETD